jgi:hypothetical protein
MLLQNQRNRQQGVKSEQEKTPFIKGAFSQFSLTNDQRNVLLIGLNFIKKITFER